MQLFTLPLFRERILAALTSVKHHTNLWKQQLKICLHRITDDILSVCSDNNLIWKNQTFNSNIVNFMHGIQRNKTVHLEFCTYF